MGSLHNDNTYNYAGGRDTNGTKIESKNVMVQSMRRAIIKTGMTPCKSLREQTDATDTPETTQPHHHDTIHQNIYIGQEFESNHHGSPYRVHKKNHFRLFG